MQNLSKHLLISEFDKEQKKKKNKRTREQNFRKSCRTKEEKNINSEKVVKLLLALWKVLLKI